jgi:hypothetical protein
MASQAVDGKINTSKVWINLYLWEPFLWLLLIRRVVRVVRVVLIVLIVLIKLVNSAAKIAATRIGLGNSNNTQS